MANTALEEVPPRRFAVFDVPYDQPIRVFCGYNDIDFKPGRGFYELSKPVLVQGTKEVILMDRTDPSHLFTGERVRQMLGLPLTDRDVQLRPVHFQDYIVFIQSTSYNRKLIGGTKFLFEWPNWDVDPPTTWDRLLEEDRF